jgi:hypothetical protein
MILKGLLGKYPSRLMLALLRFGRAIRPNLDFAGEYVVFGLNAENIWNSAPVSWAFGFSVLGVVPLENLPTKAWSLMRNRW